MVVDSPLYIIILAAGKGTRMKSARAKVLHEVFFAPMVHHVLHAIAPLQPTKAIVIVGHQRDAVQKSLANFPVELAVQEAQLGTGHAVLCAEPAIQVMEGSVMILCGDTPLIRSETLQSMLDSHNREDATLTLMTTVLDDPSHYGRIISGDSGDILAIVEEKDASSEEKEIQEINAGIYCIKTQFLFDHLKNIGTDNSQGEIYLTDIVTQAVTKNHHVQKFTTPNPADILGVNARFELSQAHQQLQLRRNRDLMDAGVSMINPLTIQVSPAASIAQDVILHSAVEIIGNSSVGTNTLIQTGVILNNVRVGNNCVIGPYSCLENCEIPNDTRIAPHSQTC
jgi:bifunctional UDP-N-acetylglucosamine pyrophosphorylase / glucosamine-1-phosphate N-acetyltransferase